MHILVINSGSSSIKFSVFETAAEAAGEARSSVPPESRLEGELSAIGTPDARLTLGTDTPKALPASDLRHAVDDILDAVAGRLRQPVEAVGYRVVHPGARLKDHQRITPEVLAELERAIAFAPLHDPAVLTVMREAMLRFPHLPHFACFDTVFHQTMPVEATTYPIPREYRAQGVRRYGFHGLSCESTVYQLRLRPEPLPDRLVIAHLGSGCSVTAVRAGRSVDTSMGLTPTGGVVMGTRPGDLDPGLMLYLLRQQASADSGGAANSLETMLNHHAGTVALSGLANDMKALRTAAAGGNEAALLALKVFTRSVTKAIGSFAFLLGGVDGIVFTGGIGEHDARSRAEILGGLEGLGIALDAGLNEAPRVGTPRITAPSSRTAVYVLPAQEDLMIARHVERMSAG
jgi:acetate kinase